MRRETRDEVLRSFLAINAMLREELAALRREVKTRAAEAKFNPNWSLQPRAPRGSPEGGQWTDGGTAPKPNRREGPRQRPQPSPRRTRPTRTGRLPAATERPSEGRVSVPLRLFRVTPLALTLPLYGDTPRPTVRTRIVEGTDDLFLVESEFLDGRRVAVFQRMALPERRVPAGLLGPYTGFQVTAPAELQTLPVEVEVDGDEVVFDPQALARAYGGDILGVTRAIGETPTQFGPITHTAEEADMALAMRLLGRSPQQVQTALDAVRLNRSAFRNNAGIAFSSRTLRVVRGRWLGPTTKSAAIPEQVAEQLRGRAFADADGFRNAFWIAVANSDLASQFNSRDVYLMHLGFAPIVEDVREHFGGRRTYIIHHRRTIASGGAVFDMSNMLIVTPSRHQDILPPNEHFVSPARRRRRDTDG